jgi:histidinol dehydrogenase
MLLTTIDLRGRRAAIEHLLPRPTDAGADVRDDVRAIIADVRHQGDTAVRAYTARFDGVQVDDLRVDPAEIEAAGRRIPQDLADALQVAYRRISAYHAFEAGLGDGDGAAGAAGTRNGHRAPCFESDGVVVRPLVRPVARAGCYAPGGRARYPSTVLMCAAPARVAGVAQIALCVPPASDGRVDDASLAAAGVAGIDEVYRIGGAQAIAALAYGTESVPAVDVVAGPGNLHVAEAKRQVSGVVGVASAFAGPSEVVVVAGPETPAALAAVDLVVQAEHGPDGLAWLVTWDPALAGAVQEQVAAIVEGSSRRADLEATLESGGYVCLVDDAEAALDVANNVAPEHLELLLADAEELLPQVRSAGAVFCGLFSPASLGDYVAGPNHVLPTNRSARFASALRADDFRRHLHAVSATPDALDRLAPHVITLAGVEGLPAHADSVRQRR